MTIAAPGGPMYTVYDNDSGVVLGTMTEAQLAFLSGHLEEESLEDTDYYIMSPTVDLMEANGADSALITLLRKGIGSKDGVEIHWTRTAA
jgi:hypothetical protein